MWQVLCEMAMRDRLTFQQQRRHQHATKSDSHASGEPLVEDDHEHLVMDYNQYLISRISHVYFNEDGLMVTVKWVGYRDPSYEPWVNFAEYDAWAVFMSTEAGREAWDQAVEEFDAEYRV